MNEKDLIATIKYVAGTKTAFLLSEIITYLEEPVPVTQLFTILSPKFAGLNLVATKRGGD